MNINELTKAAVCRLLGANRWFYKQQPSYFYREYEKYLNGKSAGKWSSLPHELQRESKKRMFKLIHDKYCEVAGIISFE